MTQLRPNRSANIANMYGEIASYIKSVVVQEDVKVQNIAIILTQSYAAHRRLIHPFSLTGKEYSTSQTKNVFENEDEANYNDHADSFAYNSENLNHISPVRIEFLDLLSSTLNHNC